MIEIDFTTRFRHFKNRLKWKDYPNPDFSKSTFKYKNFSISVKRITNKIDRYNRIKHLIDDRGSNYFGTIFEIEICKNFMYMFPTKSESFFIVGHYDYNHRYNKFLHVFEIQKYEKANDGYNQKMKIEYHNNNRDFIIFEKNQATIIDDSLTKILGAYFKIKPI